ncbi:MAG: efflux RND transporter permease subunit, partial [Rikenellaceae bacterium]
MKKILSTFVKYPFYGKIFIAVFIIAGIWSLLTMNMASFPVVESRTITVSVSYQGATPKEMEEGVVTLIENSIRGIVGIKEHSSRSQENSATVTITVQNGYDVNVALYEIKNAVDGISNFPSGAEKPTVSKGRTTTTAMFISVRSEENDLIKLKEEVYRIEDDFLASGIVSQTTVIGVPTRMEMSIEIDETTLERYGISLTEVSAAVAQYNVDSYSGVILSPEEQIKINIRNRTVEPDVIKEIVVRSNEDGSQVKIKDLGEVIFQFQDTPSSSFLEGDRNIMISISNLKEEDLKATSIYVNDYIKNYNAKGGPVKLTVVRDFLDILNGQLNILYGNGLMGIILVVVSLSLFLNFRMSLWVAWGIPASFFGMFIIANLMGISINMISLFGMILIIGILVDDGIVIGENIYTYYEKGHSPRAAAIKGTMEVLPAVFVSVTTTIVAFLPLLLIQGNLEMMYEMAVVVVACLVFSLVEGMFILPGHLASEKILSPQDPKSLYGKLRTQLDKGMFFACNKIYIPFLKWTLNHKVIMISITFAMFIFTAGLFMGGRIKFTFFPTVNEDMFSIDLAMKPGVPTEKTIQILDYIEGKVREADTLLAKEVGEDTFIEILNMRTGTAFSNTESGEHAGTINVFLRGLENSSVSSDLVKRTIADHIGKIPEAYKFSVGASNRFGAPVSISLFSKKTETLVAASEDLKEELNKMSALYNVSDNNQLGEREIHMTLKPLAYSLGLNATEISTQVRAAFYGVLAQKIQEGRSEVWF